MKNALLCVPALALGLALPLVSQDDEAGADVARQVAELEKRVVTLEKASAAQSKAAAGLLKSLDEAEAAGFTAGINPKSREVLLGAWRAVAKAAQTQTKETPEVKGRGRRGGR